MGLVLAWHQICGSDLEDRPDLAEPLEHDWLRNDLELDVMLHALVLASGCDVITTDTLDRIKDRICSSV
jgi:hypothetical protein